MDITTVLNMPRIVIAHRGDSFNETENTLAAFIAADRKGAHILETDVHLTRDKKVVIWHDDNLGSFSKSGTAVPFADMTYEDIVTESMSLIGQKVPLLTDLLEELPAACINIDLKDRMSELVDEYAAILLKTKAARRIITGSFHDGILKEFRKRNNEAVTSATPGEVKKILAGYYTGLLHLVPSLEKTILQVPEVHGGIRVVSKGLSRLVRKKGGKIHVWTVNDRRDMERLYNWGVHGIVTDDPGTALSLLKGQK